jgi:hypothetical protein
MPYKLRKAPKKELYWVITTETGKKHSKLPIPLDKAKAQMRILESALHGGVLGIVGQATSYMVDDYKEAMKSNPNLPPIEELDQFLNPNDLLWMKSVLDTYKTWDNYLTKAKGSLELDFPKNLKEFLIERSAFTDNMLKLKYYLKHISRLLPPISKEKTLVERTAEAYARGELDEMPKPAVKKSEPPKPAAPKKSTYSHPLDAIKKVQLPPVHVPKPGVEGPLAKRILKSLIEKGAPEDRARQNATYLDLVRRGLGRHGGVRVPIGMNIPSDEGEFDIEGEVARSLHPPPPPRAPAPPPILPLRLRDFPPAPPPPPPAPPARAPKRGRQTPDAVGKGKKLHGGATIQQIKSLRKDIHRLFDDAKSGIIIHLDTRTLTKTKQPPGDLFDLLDSAIKYWISPSEYDQIKKTSEYTNLRDLYRTNTIQDTLAFSKALLGVEHLPEFKKIETALAAILTDYNKAADDSDEKIEYYNEFRNMFIDLFIKTTTIGWKKIENHLLGPGIERIEGPDEEEPTYISTKPKERFEFPPGGGPPIKRARGKPKKCRKCGKFKV